MMIRVQTGVRVWVKGLRKMLALPAVQLGLRAAGYVFSGFALAAASLSHTAMPIAVALVCACPGWSAVLSALGAAGGYLAFWGSAGVQPVVWTGLALVCALLQSGRRGYQAPLLRPALAGLVISASGLGFQLLFLDATPVWLYVLRVCLGFCCTWLFVRALRGRDPLVDWLVGALGVLALAQIAPLPWLSLGFPAAGALAVMGAFPAAALAGLMLDLSGITSLSMTAVICGSYLIRFLPRYPRWLGCAAPALCCLFVMGVSGSFTWVPIPGLLAGGILGAVLPMAPKMPARRGETGVAQVRLEMAAGALLQTLQLLLETREVPVDEDALVERAGEQACSGCPCRKGCKDSPRLTQLPAALLHKPLMTPNELPILCKKSGRYLASLHRAQEQLRSIRADRERQREYREAVMQQYRFLAEYLQALSDQLSRRPESYSVVFEPRIQIFGNRPEEENGDRVRSFSGVGNRYYVILCDGMGTGMGAVREARSAQQLLHRMLLAGYPAEHALQSLNSLCALRSRAGAVTVDLLEILVDTGRGTLYKWGAAPSYLISGLGAEKIGTAGPPPGLSVTDTRETAHQLSLRRGETLVLVSDGVGEEEALHCCLSMAGASPGELASSLLTCSRFGGEDDATVVLVELDPGFPGP